MFQSSPIRMFLGVVMAAGIALAVAACGGSDSEGSSGGETAASSDIGTVASCLENRGFDVVREADQDQALVLPDEYKQSVGLIESISLGFIGDTKGTGSIAFFTGADAAEEDYEASLGFQTDDVLSGTEGTTTWNYIVTSGDDPGVAQMVTACLA